MKKEAEDFIYKIQNLLVVLDGQGKFYKKGEIRMKKKLLQMWEDFPQKHPDLPLWLSIAALIISIAMPLLR